MLSGQEFVLDSSSAGLRWKIDGKGLVAGGSGRAKGGAAMAHLWDDPQQPSTAREGKHEPSFVAE